MLGAEVDWVRNVKAAGGHATLRHGRREELCLEEIPADRRAPIPHRVRERGRALSGVPSDSAGSTLRTRLVGYPTEPHAAIPS